MEKFTFKKDENISNIKMQSELLKSLPDGNFNQSIEKYAKKNNLEVPPVKITLAYTRHMSEKDIEHFAHIFNESDIIIPENASGTDINNFWEQSKKASDLDKIKKNFKIFFTKQDFLKKYNDLLKE